MKNLEVALVNFWQLARHWKQGESAKLELSCEAGSLNLQLTAKLGHPDLEHFPPPSMPPPPASWKRKSPSQVRRQERRQKEAYERAAADENASVKAAADKASADKAAADKAAADKAAADKAAADKAAADKAAADKAAADKAAADKAISDKAEADKAAGDKHIAVKIKAKKFTCAKCDYVFESSESFKNHMREKHRVFDCDVCGNSSSSERGLDTHIHNEHSSNKRPRSQTSEKSGNNIPVKPSKPAKVCKDEIQCNLTVEHRMCCKECTNDYEFGYSGRPHKCKFTK